MIGVLIGLMNELHDLHERPIARICRCANRSQ
jgi:hypothetical protein